jgi:DNA-binding NarL/FixJ family response regulator
MPTINVVIADRQKSSRSLIRDTLQSEKGIAVVGITRNGLEATMAAGRIKPRILLLNLNLLRGKGDTLLWALRQKSPRTKMILLVRRASETAILGALSIGAQGYLKETDISAFLPQAVRQVEAGEAWVPRKMVLKILDRLFLPAPPQEDRQGKEPCG